MWSPSQFSSFEGISHLKYFPPFNAYREAGFLCGFPFLFLLLWEQRKSWREIRYKTFVKYSKAPLIRFLSPSMWQNSPWQPSFWFVLLPLLIHVQSTLGRISLLGSTSFQHNFCYWFNLFFKIVFLVLLLLYYKKIHLIRNCPH